ncbi:MAG: Hpt domain-containing protein [Gammaproteobacteria bacterium]|nr:Hpt domain-containing protein [Gammaproteobacteria bacterium]
MTDINMALLNDFIDESREHLDEMESLLLKLSNQPGNLDLLNDIFRTMHNVKGASQLTGLDKISRLSHRLEDLLDLLRQGSKQTTDEIVELLITGRDRIVELVSELESAQEELSSVDELIEQLTLQIEGGDIKASSEASPVEPVQESITPSQQAASTDAGYDEEEYDQELFKIFIEHLVEQFSLLSVATEHFKQVPPDAEHIQECMDAVNRLKSSANYMGYDELTSLFSNWSSSLEEAAKDIAIGNDAFLDFMDVYLDDLLARYPQLADSKTSVYADREDSKPAQENIIPQEQGITETVTPAVAESSASAPAINMSLINDFVDESREHLDEMESLLLQLNNELGNLDLLNDIFRTMHNIKGASQLTGLDKISRLSHRLEDLLDLLRQGNIQTNRVIVQLLITGRDRIVQLVSELDSFEEERSSVDELIAQLSELISAGVSAHVTDEKIPGDTSLTSNKESASLTETNISYDEENDKELFNIFVDYVKEQFSFLASASAHFKLAPIDKEHLLECKDAVEHLRSSANYMGYDELLTILSHWSSSLEDSCDELDSGEDIDLSFMESYLDELTRHFPVLKDLNVPSFDDTKIPDKVTTEYIPAATTTTEDIVEEVEEDKSMLQKTLDNQLFSRLNNALDASLQKVSDSEYETLNNVFDELVTPDKSDSKNLAAAKKNALEAAKKLSPNQQKTEQAKAKEQENKDKRIKKTMRVDADKIDALMNQVGELVVDRSYFYQLFNEMREMQQYLKEMVGVDQKELKMFRAFTYRLSEAISSLSRTSNELQEGVMKMRMLPISHLFNRYPRLVHDLTMNMGKKVELVLRGEETELDKMIVEELSDPLIHIIRNAIDHGLELSEERLRNNKPEQGKLILEAYQESNHIVIEVRDDGRGLNPEKIKEKAVSNGLYSRDDVERMSQRDVTNLILMPGFSTAEKITGTSGRGVGMDVVKKNIEKLNGTLDIDSIPGKGTLMRLKIPLTLAIIHALMVRVGGDMFTIPLANVDETVRISQNDTSFVEGVEVIHLRGIALPIFRLSALFSVKSDQDLDKSFVVIVNTDGQRIGFVVDEMLGQEEVVIKPLEDYVQERSGFSGATIVGDGRISLILDVYELVKMTANRQIKRHKEQAVLLKATKPKAIGSSGDSSGRLH